MQARQGSRRKQRNRPRRAPKTPSHHRPVTHAACVRHPSRLILPRCATALFYVGARRIAWFFFLDASGSEQVICESVLVSSRGGPGIDARIGRRGGWSVGYALSREGAGQSEGTEGALDDGVETSVSRVTRRLWLMDVVSKLDLTAGLI